MGVYRHLTTFAGLPVADFTAARAAGPLPPAGSVAWRIATEPEQRPFADVWAEFLGAVPADEVTALVIGFWSDDYEVGNGEPVVTLLTEAAGRLPALRALFFSDIVQEEAEISWIELPDMTPLIAAYPALERLEIRGGDLSFGPFSSDRLTALRLESGGLPAQTVRALAASDLPRLEHLDVWLGVDDYGGDSTVADLAPLLSGDRLPALRHLGLEDSPIQDEIAAAVAAAPIVARLESLSLAMGVLTDEGAEALLSGQPLTHLKRLDLHHHYLSDSMADRVRAALPGVEVDLSDVQDGTTEWRWVAVSE